jgi:hypothetical protein
MELKLKRTHFMGHGTIGELSIDGEFMYYTMEDKDRLLESTGCTAKIPKETAISRGTYKVIIDKSTRFKRLMPHVLDVPCFEGIRIHVGNYNGDTEGCILLGMGHDEDVGMVTNSKTAFGDFFPRLQKALDAGEEVTLEVS